jgi:hypothetical protein
MKPVLIFLIFLGSLFMLSCRNEPRKTSNPTPNPQQSDTAAFKQDENVRLIIDHPTDIWKTDYIAFRVFHRELGRGGRNFFSYNESSYKEIKSVGASCWNLIFYNAKTRDYYLLDSTKKMLIYDYKLNDTAQGKITRDIARYDVQFDDNKDGKFTDADAKRFFVSDRLGKFFHQVSPEGVSVQRYQFAPKENFIFIYGKKDTNNDGLFDEKDQDTLYRLDLNQSAEKLTVAQPVFSKEFEKMLQKRVETDWKLPKE